MHSQGCFNKLGNSLTTISQNKDNSRVKVQGKGSVVNKEKLDGWAIRKLITLSIIFHLIEVAKKKLNNEMLKAYWLTFHCQTKLLSAEGKVYTRYCKYKHCLVYNGIRKAELIHKYFSTIKKWSSPHFVTLTVKSCYAKGLTDRISEIHKVISRIVNKYEQRAGRGKGRKLKGIMSIESNFNPSKKTYNLHIHLIVEDKETAEILLEEWKVNWKAQGFRYLNPKAQKIQEIPDIEKQLIEMIKYTSKVFIDPTVKKKGDKYNNPVIYISAMHNIFSAMRRRHTFSSFGFLLPKQEHKKSNVKELTNPVRLIYVKNIANWIDEETEEAFSNFKIHYELKTILENNINLETE